jgi:hypothetical protein
MADTQRSLAALMALLANNTTGDISPQDVRDLVETLRMRSGALYVPVAAVAAIVIPDTINYVEMSAPAWTLNAGADGFDETGGNGRLTYKGAADAMVHLTCTVSLTAAANSQVFHVVLAKNGTPDVSTEVIVKLGIGADVVTAALHLIAHVSTGDYLSVFIRNETSGTNARLECATLQAVSMPM